MTHEEMMLHAALFGGFFVHNELNKFKSGLTSLVL